MDPDRGGMAALACMAGVETTIDWEQIELS